MQIRPPSCLAAAPSPNIPARGNLFSNTLRPCKDGEFSCVVVRPAINLQDLIIVAHAYTSHSLDMLRLKLDELCSAEEDLLYRLADIRKSIGEARSEIEKIIEERNVDVTARLPDEILSKILIFEQVRHRCGFKADICRVSRRWNNLAIHTPSLWSKLFDEDNSFPKTFDRSRRRFCTYLSRSGDHFLDVKLFKTPRLWPYILPHAHRIYSLSLSSDRKLIDNFATVKVQLATPLHRRGICGHPKISSEYFSRWCSTPYKP